MMLRCAVALCCVWACCVVFGVLSAARLRAPRLMRCRRSTAALRASFSCAARVASPGAHRHSLQTLMPCAARSPIRQLVQASGAHYAVPERRKKSAAALKKRDAPSLNSPGYSHPSERQPKAERKQPSANKDF